MKINLYKNCNTYDVKPNIGDVIVFEKYDFVNDLKERFYCRFVYDYCDGGKSFLLINVSSGYVYYGCNNMNDFLKHLNNPKNGYYIKEIIPSHELELRRFS